MEFRYDFLGEKLDLSKIRKQAVHYIGQMREVTYIIFLPDYKVVAEIATPDDSRAHRVTIYFSETKKDADGNLTSVKAVCPRADTRFKEIKTIQRIFPPDGFRAMFESHSAQETVNALCDIITLVHKINHLKAFI